MKTILKPSILTVTAILLTAVLSSYAPPDCPPPNDGAVALFPCPEDCSKFWECDNGNPVLHECPDGLWYCSELHACSPFWDFFCNFSHCGGGTGGGGDTGGGGTGGGAINLETCYETVTRVAGSGTHFRQCTSGTTDSKIHPCSALIPSNSGTNIKQCYSK